MSSQFKVGHRVIVQRWPLTGDPETNMNGYYGHIVQLHPRSGRRMVSVALQGRVGSAPTREGDLELDQPWTFYEHEIDHAD